MFYSIRKLFAYSYLDICISMLLISAYSIIFLNLCLKNLYLSKQNFNNWSVNKSRYESCE